MTRAQQDTLSESQRQQLLHPNAAMHSERGLWCQAHQADHANRPTYLRLVREYRQTRAR
ncbi:MAG: hypothetical protein AB7S55_02360 [Thiomonas sp.]|jgi:hypothetical protein